MYKRLKSFWPKEWPTDGKWKRFTEVLSPKEKVVFFGLIAIAVFSLFYACSSFYFSRTEMSPAYGGIYREGVIGSYAWLAPNPIYLSRSDAERDISELIFSGLISYNEKGEVTPLLISEYSVKDNRVFDIRLKEDIYWSDGERITADDVIFTVETIQDPAFKSTLRQLWVGVGTEKLSDLEVRFILDSPSSIFIENLTLKIIPRHIWKDIPSREFPLSIHISPVGSGPYRQRDIRETSAGEIKSVLFERNPHYFGKTPYIDNIMMIFFESEEALLRAKVKGEIDGFALSNIPPKKLEENNRFVRYNFILPRYFSLVFNTKSSGLAGDLEIRKALNYATDKERLIENILSGEAEVVNSPFLLDFYEIENGDNPYPYHPEKAKELFLKAGFYEGVKTVREESVFLFKEDMKEGAQGEAVRMMQRCFIELTEEHSLLYPEGEITGFFDAKLKEAVIHFQEIHSEDILQPWGFEKGTGTVSTTTRKKLDELCSVMPKETMNLEIEIVTVNQPTLTAIANELSKQWEVLGVQTNIIEKDIQSFERDVIRQRDYESMLFGTALTATPNPLPLWHSSKTEDFGLNLSGYENKEADELMEKIMNLEREELAEALVSLEEMILEDAPAIFLYNPIFAYFISERVNGVEESSLINSSKRFEGVEEWYIRTKRAFR